MLLWTLGPQSQDGKRRRTCVCVCMRAVCTWEITQGLLWFGSESLLTINVFSINDFQNPQISLNISCPWSQITMKSSTFIHFSFLHYCYTLNIHDLIVAAQVWKSASFNYDHLTFMQTWRICLNLRSSGFKWINRDMFYVHNKTICDS